MEQNKKFKLVSSKRTRYLLPNILTLGGVCLGISSIKFSIDGNFSLAVILILLAAILDALVTEVKKINQRKKSYLLWLIQTNLFYCSKKMRKLFGKAFGQFREIRLTHQILVL